MLAPPSTVIIEPVIIAASSVAANMNAFAMSSASCKRPSGVFFSRRSKLSGLSMLVSQLLGLCSLLPRMNGVST